MIATESVMDSVNATTLWRAPGRPRADRRRSAGRGNRLRLLLEKPVTKPKAVTSPAAVLEAIKQRDFDLVLMDLNYARDTTSGQEGLDLITNIRTLDQHLARRGPDRLGLGRAGGRSNASRRARLRSKALGQPQICSRVCSTQIELGRTASKGNRPEAESRKGQLRNCNRSWRSRRRFKRRCCRKTCPISRARDRSVLAAGPCCRRRLFRRAQV